jgi:hypothetical protein
MDADKLPGAPPDNGHANTAAPEAESEATRRLRASLGSIERRLGVGGDEVWHALKTRPFLASHRPRLWGSVWL